jgi:predicted PurR-regulated permease PerM
VDEISSLLTRFLEDKPEYQSYVDSVLNRGAEFIEHWVDTNIIQQVDTIIANITGSIVTVIKGIGNMIIGIVISIYLLYHKETFGAQAKKMVCGVFRPKFANAVVSTVEFVDRSCGGFISGKILDSLIIGVICYISMLILQMPYAALIAVIVGVTNIIPFFGPIIGAIPSAFLIVFISPVKCLIFIIYIIVLQQIDGNIIGPRILGRTVGLSGFWIMFAILFFGSLYGFWGMLLGVPVFSVIYAGIKKLISMLLKKRSMPQDTAEYAGMDHIDLETKAIVKKAPAATIPEQVLESDSSEEKSSDSGSSDSGYCENSNSDNNGEG